MKFFSKSQLSQRGQLLFLVCLGCLSCLFLSCSEDDEAEGEYDNWQARNEAYFASLADSLGRDAAHWVRLKSYSLDQSTAGAATDYIYAHIITSGTGTESPAFTDSVRVIYQGRLIPSKTYPEGYVFDGTVYGRFSAETGYTTKQLVSRMSDGYCTALQHMHRGDHWRIYVPYTLAYGESGSGSIPGYSVCIFDLMLIDFSPAGESVPTWSSRRR